MNLLIANRQPIGDDGCILREIEAADAVEFQKIFEQLRDAGFYYAYLWNFAGQDLIDSAKVGERFVERALAARQETPRQIYRYAICDHDNHVMGSVVLLHNSNEHCDTRLTGGGEIGYFIAPPYQGRHIATIAASALIESAKLRLGIKSVWGKVHPENIASRRILEKLGMSFLEKTVSEEDTLMPERLLYLRHIVEMPSI